MTRHSSHIAGYHMGESRRIVVGEWSVIPARNLLERPGESVRIKPRSMEVLVYLADRAGEVISTEELVETVWQGRVVGDGTVYQSITNLRQAFGDSTEVARFIETIPKRGYRLVAPVAIPEPEAPNEPVAVRPGRTASLGAAATLILAVALVVPWYMGQRPGENAAQPPLPNSVAVLPLINLSPDPEHAYFAAGIHASIINQLGSLSNLSVIARSSVMQYEGVRVSEVARDLRVESIMEGSVRYAGDRVLVAVELIDGATETQLWAGEYEGDLSDVLGIQADIATNIANTLEATFSPEEAARVSALATENSRAYDFYLSGLDYFNRTDDSLTPLAVQQFRRAIDEDPDFGLAWAALARAHLIEYLQGRDRSDTRLAWARESVERALALAPQSGDAHLAMASYHFMGAQDYPAALAALAVAEERMPGRAEIYEMRSYIQRRANEWISAVANMERAIELDPRNIDLHLRQAENYMRLREYEQGERHYDRILELVPDHLESHSFKALIPLARDGDSGPAKVAAENPDETAFPEFLGWHAAIYERDYVSALRFIERAFEEVDTHDWQYSYYTREAEYGIIHALDGKPELAVAHFESARMRIEEALNAAPNDARLHVAMGEALVGLGQQDAGVRAALDAIALAPRSADALLGEQIQYDAVVRVLGPAGNVNAVMDELDDYLTQNGWWSIEGLLRDPRLDLVRDDPRFQALVRKYRRADAD